MRARKAGGKWEVFSAKRFGRNYKNDFAPGAIWVHVVSLGETRAANPFIRSLLDSGQRVLLTHLTATGWAEAERVYAQEKAAGLLQQAWFPYDFPGAARGFLKHYQPKIAILIEREVWPNMVATLIRQNIPVILASARMSARSLRRTLRYHGLMRPCYQGLTHVYAQSLQDARRLEIAGAKRVCVSGNFKFDLHVDIDKKNRGASFAQNLGRRVIAIASTREGEDQVFIQAIDYQLKRMQQLGIAPELQPLFFLIPRHPQRFNEVAALIADHGLRQVSRTELIELGDNSSSAIEACRQAQIVLGNTLGEMPWYYSVCDVAIVGGSFAPLGGQNFIEASAIGCPVIVGPHTDNFAQAVHDALAAQAILQVANQDEAIKSALHLLEDNTKLNKISEQASYWVGQHAGAVTRVMDGISQII